MVRNAVIAILAVVSAALAYGYYQASKEADKQAQLVIDTRDKADKDLQALRDKLASEQRAREVVEKDAKAVSAKLAEEQSARDAAEQAVKAANERLTQIQNALANAEQSARDARDGTLEFEGEANYRLVRLHLQHGFGGHGGRGQAPLETIASAPEACKSQHVGFDDVRR